MVATTQEDLSEYGDREVVGDDADGGMQEVRFHVPCCAMTRPMADPLYRLLPLVTAAQWQRIQVAEFMPCIMYTIQSMPYVDGRVQQELELLKTSREGQSRRAVPPPSHLCPRAVQVNVVTRRSAGLLMHCLYAMHLSTHLAPRCGSHPAASRLASVRHRGSTA